MGTPEFELIALNGVYVGILWLTFRLDYWELDYALQKPTIPSFQYSIIP